MSWDARSLETVELSDGDTVYYTYNSSGIRTQKRIVSSTGAVTTHDYLLDGTNILKETVSGDENYVLEYLYDESGVAGIKYNGSALYFIKNLQGDVIALTDDSAIKLVQYTYDAWGNVISITGGLASLLGNINPIRYRGYYYDTDTGYYYLNSRYYDPTVGRFLNGDAFIGINGGIQGYNMYAYCNNSPVAFADASGTVMMPNILPDEPEPPKLQVKRTTQKNNSDQNDESPKRVDITQQLNYAMTQNSELLKQYQEDNGKLRAIKYFIDQVKPGGEWDFKSQDEWNLQQDVIYIYNGIELRYDDIGNIHYGYVGRVLFGSDTLLMAGGLVQIYAGTSSWSYWKTNFDDPRDQWAINFGCQLWDEEET